MKELLGQQMNLKKQEIERTLGQADSVFRAVAARHGLWFEERAGPGFGRALRATSGLERGVFLELKKHWMECDPQDLDVTLSSCAWLRLNPAGHPFYFLSRKEYEGRLIEFVPRSEELLNLAAQHLSDFDEDFARHHGQYMELPQV